MKRRPMKRRVAYRIFTCAGERRYTKEQRLRATARMYRHWAKHDPLYWEAVGGYPDWWSARQ